MNTKTTYLNVIDHSVSGEEFQLLHNEDLGMLETFPQPSETGYCLNIIKAKIIFLIQMLNGIGLKKPTILLKTLL